MKKIIILLIYVFAFINIFAQNAVNDKQDNLTKYWSSHNLYKYRVEYAFENSTDNNTKIYGNVVLCRYMYDTVINTKKFSKYKAFETVIYNRNENNITYKTDSIEVLFDSENAVISIIDKNIVKN